jgi:ribonuclease-3
VALDEFARKAGLAFRDPELLWRALTHRSYLNEHTDALEDNERLEFLGDAALDFLSAAWLYRRFPEMDEGQMTRLRAALVRTEQLAIFARELGLGEALRLGRGEEASGGRSRSALLCGAFEAVLGALYLDQGIHAVEAFVEPRLSAATEAILDKDSQIDPRSLLQILAQAERGETPRYRTVGARGPDHAREFVVEVTVGAEAMGRGEGRTKQDAAQQAAADALTRFRQPNGAEG